MSTPQSMLKNMVLALAGMILVYFGVGQLLADRWHVDSGATVAAPPAAVAGLVLDFGTWAKWSSMDANLGPQTVREVTGTPGSVGHRITWTGSQGKATLTVTAVEGAAGPSGSLQYEFHRQGPVESAPHLGGRGSVAWQAAGSGTQVRWHDESTWENLPGRWIGWFGALQERVRQIQGTSLAGLRQAVEPDAAPGTGASTVPK